jgi:hypothetical protein
MDDPMTEQEIGEFFNLEPAPSEEPVPERTIILRDDSNTQAVIRKVCDEYRDFLLAKNEQYGDSAIHPLRIFSKANPEEQLLVRIDDKLSRLTRGNASLEPDEDIMDDLVGYWLLLKVVRNK